MGTAVQIIASPVIELVKASALQRQFLSLTRLVPKDYVCVIIEILLLSGH